MWRQLWDMFVKDLLSESAVFHARFVGQMVVSARCYASLDVERFVAASGALQQSRNSGIVYCMAKQYKINWHLLTPWQNVFVQLIAMVVGWQRQSIAALSSTSSGRSFHSNRQCCDGCFGTTREPNSLHAAPDPLLSPQSTPLVTVGPSFLLSQTNLNSGN